MDSQATSHRPKEPQTVHGLSRAEKLACEFEAMVHSSSNVSKYHILISCSKSKQALGGAAREIYNSPLFNKSAELAQSLDIPFHILSAKHGLVSPEEHLASYDFSLKGQSVAMINEWAQMVDQQIADQIPSNQSLVFLAGKAYTKPLECTAIGMRKRFCTPMEGLSLGNRLTFLNTCLRIEERRRQIFGFYTLFEEIAKIQSLRTLSDVLRDKLPDQGVYFFFDLDEPSRFSKSLPRLVRVGTHGVSEGSRATLRTRLRTHLGTSKGLGNHRSSVFRLHIGNAIIARDKRQQEFQHWGRGQNATPQIITSEMELEAEVSAYIRSLYVLIIPIADTAGVKSLRSFVEKQMIALFTEDFFAPDRPSERWLGNHSNRQVIKTSGLWNVREVGGKYGTKFLEFARHFWERQLAY